MSAEPEIELAASLRALLAASTEVKAVLGDPARLYDRAPNNAVFPYLSLARMETTPLDRAGADALQHVVTLHVWSRHDGQAEALRALSAIRTALHNARPAPETRQITLLNVTYTDIFRSDDDVTLAVIRLRAITEPTEQ